MKYLLMLYADEQAGQSLPAEQMAGFMQQMAAYQQALQKAGAFIATAALQPTIAARTLTTNGGKLQIHDGPYAEAREQFGGYFVIEAADMEQATKLAAQCPAATWGWVEIRPYHPQYAPA